MAVLHTTNKSPLQTNDLASCLRLAQSGCGILLIEDAVYGAMDKAATAASIRGALKDKAVYVLGPDLAARGLAADAVVDGIKLVDYGGFVDLAVEYHHVQAWL